MDGTLIPLLESLLKELTICNATACSVTFTPESEITYLEAGITAIGKRLLIESVKKGDASLVQTKNIQESARASISSPRVVNRKHLGFVIYH